MSAKTLVLLATALVLGAGAGFLAAERLPFPTVPAASGGGKKIAYWVAPMDPNYRRDGPGKSPMGMDLIPVHEGEEPGKGADKDVVEISPAVMNSLGVRSVAAAKADLASRIRTVGYVGYNENRTSHVHVRDKGWVENLKVRSIGVEVGEREPLFDMFSREIASATYEFIRERQRGDGLGARGAEAKLRAFGMSEAQIRGMEKSGQADERIRVLAPQRGVVVALNIGEGMFIDPAMTVLTITDLSSVWVIGEVFESQADRVALGMEAEAALPHDPGRVWRGRVEFIYPEIDPVTRTLRVRLRFDNPNRDLRPNMFVNVALVGRTLAGVLSVPGEAVIRDGRIERVIRDLGDGRFKAAAVATGLRADGRVQITDGLAEGDRVVVSAQFLIDSESNLKGALARLTPPGAKPAQAGPVPGRGTILERVDPDKVNVTHEPIQELGWPAMTMHFRLLDGPAALPDELLNRPVRFEVARDADGTYGIRAIAPADGPEAWTEAVVNKVAGPALLNVTHQPVPAIGWPGMTMDLAVAPEVPTDGIAAGQAVRLGLAKGPDGMYRITAIERDGGGKR